jgi:vacuolar protein sorting-associated protein 45
LGISLKSEFSKSPAVLLVLERDEDLLTPLITHWGYQSLLHDILGIENNKVKCKGVEHNLNQLHDSFYAKNIHSNYGEVATNLKTELQGLSHSK